MSLLVFLLACGLGAVLGLLARPFARVGRLIGIGGLLVAFAAALFIRSGTSLTVANVTMTGSQYAGLFLACSAASGLLLCVVALASGWPDELAPAALASFAGLAVATTASDPAVALAAGAAAAAAGALVIANATPRTAAEDGRLSELRTIGLVAAGLAFAAIAILRPPWADLNDGTIFAVAFLGLGLALAVRSGAVPFHVPATRLRETAAPLAPALLLVWMPAGLGVLAISWSASTFGAGNDWMRGAVDVLQLVAVATLVLGPLAALVHDELEEVAAYSIAADAGFVLLALAARTDAAAEPARLWLLAFVAAKTGLVAWTAAVSHAFGTSNVPRLRGWLRRTPLLGVALAVIVVATLGWPGSAVYEARSTIIRLALPGQLQFLFAASIVLSIGCFGRLLVIGALAPSRDVRAARSELPKWPAATANASRSPARAVAPRPTTTADGPTATAGTDLAPTSAAADPRPPRGTRRKLAVAWRLNGTLEVSLLVVAGAALAATIAFGGFGASHAAGFGIPLDTAAHATPTPRPSTPIPSATPVPSATPTLGPGGSIGPSPSGGFPEASPSEIPVKTSGPARGGTD